MSKRWQDFYFQVKYSKKHDHKYNKNELKKKLNKHKKAFFSQVLIQKKCIIFSYQYLMQYLIISLIIRMSYKQKKLMEFQI